LWGKRGIRRRFIGCVGPSFSPQGGVRGPPENITPGRTSLRPVIIGNIFRINLKCGIYFFGEGHFF